MALALLNDALVEFVGTFFLVSSIVFSVASGSSLAPIAIGFTLMVVVYAGGPISGGHYNPAVTLAVWLRGKQKHGVMGYITYTVTQIVAGLLAAIIANNILPQTANTLAGASSAGGSLATQAQQLINSNMDEDLSTGTIIENVTRTVILVPEHLRISPYTVGLGSAFYVEILYTFLLAWTVLQTATTKKAGANSYFGLAIGSSVLVGAVSAGWISGGAFNPAVGIGMIGAAGFRGYGGEPATRNLADLTGAGTEPARYFSGGAQHIWIYMLGPWIGGALAGAFFKLVNPDEMGAFFEDPDPSVTMEKLQSSQLGLDLAAGKSLDQIFAQYDTDGDGVLSKDEMRAAMEEPAV